MHAKRQRVKFRIRFGKKGSACDELIVKRIRRRRFRDETDLLICEVVRERGTIPGYHPYRRGAVITMPESMIQESIVIDWLDDQ